jgi:hypothetical protein
MHFAAFVIAQDRHRALTDWIELLSTGLPSSTINTLFRHFIGVTHIHWPTEVGGG